MNRWLACPILLLSLAPHLRAQESTTRSLPSPTPAPQKGAAKPASTPAAKNPLAAAIGGKFAAPSGEAITTEIYSDQAFFDSVKYVGTFSGHVVVKDPRFNLQANKLTVYLAKGEEKGLEKAVAEGNVGVVHEIPGENGGPPLRSIGRAERAVYIAKEGNVELTGTPRVQSGPNSHVATSPETVMLISQSGQLTTRGPSRTDIRQEPKPQPTPTP